MAKTNSKNSGGRPPHFTPEQVSKVIDALLAEGHPADKIDGKKVREMLITKFDVSGGIREEAVARVVEQIIEDRAEAECRALLKALPASVGPQVDHVLSGVKKDLMLLVARENAVCVSAAEKECEELRADKRNANWRITELETSVEDQAGELAALGAERDALAADLALAREDLLKAQAELARRGRQASTADRLVAELRDPAVRGDLRAVLAELVAPPPAEAPPAS